MYNKIKIFPVIAVAAIALLQSCRPAGPQYTSSLAVTVTNPSPVGIEESPVVLPVEKILEKKPDFNPRACGLLFRQAEIPFQFNDLNGDSVADELVFTSLFGPSETREFVLAYNPEGSMVKEFPKRTQAELSVRTGGEWKDRKYIGGTFINVSSLRVPAEHTDHSDFMRYEGPGWESDKVAYRFYLDWRNATDIFGKVTDTMVLQKIGQPGTESYHNLSSWGMDIFKVDQSLGIGSIGMWQNKKANRVSVTDSILCSILLNGNLQSQVETRYYGWKAGEKKCNLVSDMSIMAGSRITRHDVKIDDPSVILCTGMILNDSVEVMTNRGDTTGGYVYFGTWGWQSLNRDNLGLGLIVDRDDLQTITDDGMSYVLVFKPGLTGLRYYFMAAWEKEPGGIRSADAFREYLEKNVALLEHPLQVSLK